MSLAYLLDEHVPRALRAAILRRSPDLSVWHIGQAGAPPFGTPDPLVLQWCESADCLLVTNNRKSMPGHLAEHLSRGGHIPGILILDLGMSLVETAEHLILVAIASFPEEHRDTIEYLPLT
jgi:hypothetical protein